MSGPLTGGTPVYCHATLSQTRSSFPRCDMGTRTPTAPTSKFTKTARLICCAWVDGVSATVSHEAKARLEKVKCSERTAWCLPWFTCAFAGCG